jgi:hypothetical protein
MTSIGTCMRNHYSIYIRPPLNPSKKGKSRSEIRKRNQTADQTTMERRRNKPAHLGVTRKRSSKITIRY